MRVNIEDHDRVDIPAFKVSKTSTAVTFHLHPIAKEGANGPDRVFGWALATVNNDTGELAIQSDWGSWSYRWNINSLGRVGDSGDRATLMQFIADRAPGHCDYLADKLTAERNHERARFDPELTVAALRAELLKNRLEQGRAVIEYYADYDEWTAENPMPDWARVGGDWHAKSSFHAADTREVWIHGRSEQWALSKATARAIYDELDDLTNIQTAETFCHQVMEIEGIEWITSEPFEYLQHRPDRAYVILESGILPALVEAAFAHAHPGRHRCDKRMGREDGAGHWRDFHRGHNCHLDPTPLAPPAETPQP